jgi:hypothetical protein
LRVVSCRLTLAVVNGLECAVSNVKSICLKDLKDNCNISASFLVQFIGFKSLTSYFDVKYMYWHHINHIPASFSMYLVINKCVTAVKDSKFSGHYLHNRSTLDTGVLG